MRLGGNADWTETVGSFLQLYEQSHICGKGKVKWESETCLSASLLGPPKEELDSVPGRAHLI